MTIVSDTSPITNLAAIAQLDLLQQIYGGIVIPSAASDACGRMMPNGVFLVFGWIFIV